MQRSALCKPRRELTSIYLQTLASIQPRTSLVKFARCPYTDPPSRLRGILVALIMPGDRIAGCGIRGVSSAFWRFLTAHVLLFSVCKGFFTNAFSYRKCVLLTKSVLAQFQKTASRVWSDFQHWKASAGPPLRERSKSRNSSKNHQWPSPTRVSIDAPQGEKR